MRGPAFIRPTIPKLNVIDPIDQFEFQEDLKAFVREKQDYGYLMQNVYRLIVGQCTESMSVAIQSHLNYLSFHATSDDVTLLRRCIQEISYEFESLRYKVLAIYDGGNRAWMSHSLPIMEG
jgi:hypothetical protein